MKFDWGTEISLSTTGYIMLRNIIVTEHLVSSTGSSSRLSYTLCIRECTCAKNSVLFRAMAEHLTRDYWLTFDYLFESHLLKNIAFYFQTTDEQWTEEKYTDPGRPDSCTTTGSTDGKSCNLILNVKARVTTSWLKGNGFVIPLSTIIMWN